jgi:hypothetical protein
MSEEIGTLDRRMLARGLKIFLDILFYLILLVGVLLVGSLPVSVSSGYHDGWDLIVPVTIGEGSLRPRLNLEIAQDSQAVFEVARIRDGYGKLHLFHHNLSLCLLNAAFIILILAVLLWAITLLRRILATTVGGHPFHPSNPRRLNLLGWIILAASVLASLLQYLASRWVLTRVEIINIPVSPVIQSNKEWVVCGLLVLVLAAIWKQAVQMAEEQALTV